MSGSIACYKACELISMWVKAGHDVQVVCTESALNFIGKATLEGLTGKPVLHSTFQEGQMMDHIHLMRWCDFIILAPATANTINSLANGIGDNLVSTMFLAHDFKKPYYVAPAMNESMLLHPATQESLNRISTWGVSVLDSGKGQLACGENGQGRLLEPIDIHNAIFNKASIAPSAKTNSSGNNGQNTQNVAQENSTPVASTNSPNKTMKPKQRPSHLAKVLITSGGTKEPIDGVRFISNMSTGRTGASLADELYADYDITLIAAKGSVMPTRNMEILTYSDFKSLEQVLKNTLSTRHFDAVIHLAAISDFSVSSITNGKDSFKPDVSFKLNTTDEMSIHLKRNPKLIEKIKDYSLNKNIVLVGFKLTNSKDVAVRNEAIDKILSNDDVNFVVHNDLNEITSNSHKFRVYDKNKKLFELNNTHELAQALPALIVQKDSTPETDTVAAPKLSLKPDFFHIGANK